MDKIWRSIIKYKKITLFIVAVIALSGLYGYYIVPRNEMPDISTPIAVITIVYPGASADDIDSLVVQQIEDEIAELEGYAFSDSYIYNSYAIVTLRMNYGIDLEQTWDQLRRSMEDLQKELPPECFPLDVNTELMDTAGIILALTGDNYSYEELSSYAEQLSRHLSRIEGMARFNIDGKQDKEVIIEVDYKLLNQNNLSLNDITQLIQGQNIEIPSGTLSDGTSKINLKTEGTFASIADIKSIVIGIASDNGSILRLEDVADISMKTADDMYRVRHNGANAVLLTGYFEPGSNIVITGKSVDKVVADFIASLPSGISVDKVLDQPADVKKSVNNFAMSLLQGVIFVIIVVFFGMGLRNAIIVSTAIPLSICATFGVMEVLGVELHLVSIASLIIALGMLVDNAIVVSDAIQLRLDQGEERLQACINGVREVAIPVLTSTLTTIAAFSPFLWMQSIAGEFMITLPIIIIISLTASYLVALLVTPTMAYIFFKPGQEQKDKSYRLRLFFNKLLAKAMKQRALTVVIVIALIAGTAFLAFQLPLQFFPYADKDLIFIDVKAERNIDIDTTQAITDQIETVLKEQPEILQYTTSLGGGLPKFYTTVFNFKQSANTAQILMKVDLSISNQFDDYGLFVDMLQRKLDTKVLGGKAVVRRLELAEYLGNPVRVRLTGDSLNELEAAAEVIKQQLYQIKGATNINDDFPERIYEYNIVVNNDKAAYMGLSKYDIQNEVSIALSGRQASTFNYHGGNYAIKVKSDIKSIEELQNLRIKSSIVGQKTILKNVADVELKATLPGVNRHDRNYAIMVTSDLLSGYEARDIVNILDKKLVDLDLGDVQVSYDGEDARIKQNFGDMGAQAVIAVVMVYMILLFQFRSFRQPLIILVTIPLSVIGSICALYIIGQPLSFTALMGMVSLMGIVVNNAIVLIDYINRSRKEGQTIIEACMHATDKRFRPIILSTTTTFIGMIPLLLSGSDLFGPLSISLMFGLLVSTILTLVVIPLVYSMIEFKTERNINLDVEQPDIKQL